MKITASGGSTASFGPYYLDVGCTATSFTIADDASFATSGNNKWVGDAVANVYTLSYPPVATKSYCVITSNIALKSDGVTASTKVINCASQVCTIFDLADTINPETITFKIKSTFTNSFEHVSPEVTVTATCNNNYVITETDGTVTSPQIISHGNAALGFTMPQYETTQNVGCPTNAWDLSTSGSSMIAHTTLTRTGSAQTFVVKPTDNSVHFDYNFYVKVTADGGGTEFFGPYYLYVGCTSSTVSYADNAAFSSSSTAYSVGVSTTSLYIFPLPTATQVWCTPQTTTIVTNDVTGTAWAGTVKLLPTDS